jgi:hypothetical protein
MTLEEAKAKYMHRTVRSKRTTWWYEITSVHIVLEFTMEALFYDPVYLTQRSGHPGRAKISELENDYEIVHSCQSRPLDMRLYELRWRKSKK